MKTERPQRTSGGRAKPGDPAEATREQLVARIKVLQAELARLKSPDGARAMTAHEHLTTVKVRRSSKCRSCVPRNM